jgi:hypothetical protein
MGTIIKAQRAFLATDSERFKHIEVAYVERGQARGSSRWHRSSRDGPLCCISARVH